MNIGFTGTRRGMTAKQVSSVTDLINQLKPDKVIHGACYGADYDFHDICIKARGGYTVSRPPLIELYPSDIENTVADCRGFDISNPQLPPLERNKRIVNASDRLIATPREFEEVLRSGTWSTIRYAKKVGKIVYIVQPDGDIK
jgi:predicted Rossmann fold nucleotide-binding protein DprA/Smf involved in DNA uptake